MDVDTLGRLLETMDSTTLRAAKIAKALEKFTLIVDFEQPREARIASYKEAREALRPLMEAKNGSTMPVFYAIGNAHLDLAWLWPMEETHRKTERTFAAQLRLIEQYPEYKYVQSQPAAYEMCRKYYPELFERIKEAIKGGQWIADGAMWVEPDTNMASGEALIRQLVHGKRYYKEELGVDSEVLWLPDTFGYTAALPQILKGCGVNYLVTQKIFWSYNEGEQFPYHYFTWQGMDGSEIDSFLPTSYTYRTHPSEVNENLAESCAGAGSGCFPASVRIWRWWRRPGKRFYRICKTSGRSGRQRKSKNGRSAGILPRYGSAGRPGKYLCWRIVFQCPQRNIYLSGDGKTEQQKMRTGTA